MKLLLDTHVYIWWCQNPDRIRKTAKALIQDASNEIHISVTTPWEMLTKYQKGKLQFDFSLLRPDSVYGFEILPITIKHTEAYTTHPT